MLIIDDVIAEAIPLLDNTITRHIYDIPKDPDEKVHNQTTGPTDR